MVIPWNKWPAVAQEVIKLAKLKKADKNIREILKDYNVADNAYDSTFGLILLPFLFKKITKLSAKSKTGKAWNPEKTEVLSSFIYHVKEDENIENSLREINNTLERLHSEHK